MKIKVRCLYIIGTCKIRGNTSYCCCNNGYIGDNCDISICNKNLCGNNGIYLKLQVFVMWKMDYLLVHAIMVGEVLNVLKKTVMNIINAKMDVINIYIDICVIEENRRSCVKNFHNIIAAQKFQVYFLYI